MFNEDTNKIFIVDLKVTVLEENTSEILLLQLLMKMTIKRIVLHRKNLNNFYYR